MRSDRNDFRRSSIAVRWSYKNTSSKPIGAFNHPRIKLKAPDGTLYEPDLGASSFYASEAGTNAKVFSDLNPGIEVMDADVFEVSDQLFDPATWQVVIQADQDVTVHFVAQAMQPSSNNSQMAQEPTANANQQSADVETQNNPNVSVNMAMDEQQTQATDLPTEPTEAATEATANDAAIAAAAADEAVSTPVVQNP